MPGSGRTFFHYFTTLLFSLAPSNIYGLIERTPPRYEKVVEVKSVASRIVVFNPVNLINDSIGSRATMNEVNHENAIGGLKDM